MTLDAFWLSFMPRFEHGVGVVAHITSAVAFYLMITKTPESGKPLTRYLMIMQAAITFTDINIGILFCPIVLLPAPACMCFGLICQWGLPGHIALTLTFGSIMCVALSVVFCFHFKYSTVVEITKYRNVSECEKIAFRMGLTTILSIPCALMAFCYLENEAGIKNIQVGYPSLMWIFSDSYHGFAYSLRSPDGEFTVVSYLLFFGGVAMLTTVVLCGFFVGHTLFLLSKQTQCMSERTQKMQQKLTRTLMMQINLPLSVQSLPMVVVGISTATGLGTTGFINGTICIQMFHCTLHTIMLIATTPSYREALVSWCRIRPHVREIASTTSMSVR